MCFGGNKTQTTQQTSSSTDINPTFKPYYEDLAKRAKDASLSISNTPYTGNFVAPANPLERAGVTSMAGVVDAAMPGITNLASSVAARAPGYVGAGEDLKTLGIAQARGDFLDPNNPILRGAIDASARPVFDNLARNVNRIGATAAANGAYGNSRVGTHITNPLIAETGRGVNDMAAKLTNDWFSRERTLQQNSGNLIQQAVGLEGAPLTIANNAMNQGVAAGALQGKIGETSRALDDLTIKNDLLKFQDAIAAPNRPLTPYAQLLGVIPTTTSTTGTATGTQVQKQDPFTQILQSIIGGASMVAGLPI